MTEPKTKTPARFVCAACGRVTNRRVRPDRFGFARQEDRTPCQVHGNTYLFVKPASDR